MSGEIGDTMEEEWGCRRIIDGLVEEQNGYQYRVGTRYRVETGCRVETDTE